MHQALSDFSFLSVFFFFFSSFSFLSELPKDLHKMVGHGKQNILLGWLAYINDTATIVLGVLASIFAAALIVGFLCWIIRRKKQRRKRGIDYGNNSEGKLFSSPSSKSIVKNVRFKVLSRSLATEANPSFKAQFCC